MKEIKHAFLVVVMPVIQLHHLQVITNAYNAHNLTQNASKVYWKLKTVRLLVTKCATNVSILRAKLIEVVSAL